MLELLLLLVAAAVFLPDLVCGLLLAVLWLAEKIVIGACRLVLALQALRSLFSSVAAPEKTLSRHRRPSTAN